MIQRRNVGLGALWSGYPDYQLNLLVAVSLCSAMTQSSLFGRHNDAGPGLSFHLRIIGCQHDLSLVSVDDF